MFTNKIDNNTPICILPLTEKVADNAALSLVESTKAADVDKTIVLRFA